jgi:hypothetical protein
MPPATVGGRLLLGWMKLQEAKFWLQQNCWFDPPLTDEQVEAHWNQYRTRVENLPERNADEPQRFPIPASHNQLVSAFFNRFPRGPEVLDIININPLDLIAYQFYVVTDRCDGHVQQHGEWAKKFLVLDRPVVQLVHRYEDNAHKFSLPHAEHFIGPQPDGAFRIFQTDGYVSVTKLHGRLFLKAGYHRSFAFARATMNEPEASAKCALVVLTRNLPAELAPTCPDKGLRTLVLGLRPPFLRDFFDDNLAMTVRLRKRRWEAHLLIKAVDDP